MRRLMRLPRRLWTFLAAKPHYTVVETPESAQTLANAHELASRARAMMIRLGLDEWLDNPSRNIPPGQAHLGTVPILEALEKRIESLESDGNGERG